MGELRTLEYRDGDVVLEGQLATPPGPGPHPAILVMHNAHGLGEQVRERAQRLAKAGYVALASDMYGGGRHFASAEETGEPFAALQHDPLKLRGRVLAAYKALTGLPQVDVKRTGAVGFCFGGQCVLELARSGADVKAVVSFHGLLHAPLPAQPGAVKAKVMVLTGAKDPYAPAENVQALQAEMAAAGADWQVTVYGEGFHAFTDPVADTMPIKGLRYDPLLDRLSWGQAMAFIEATVLA